MRALAFTLAAFALAAAFSARGEDTVTPAAPPTAPAQAAPAPMVGTPIVGTPIVGTATNSTPAAPAKDAAAAKPGAPDDSFDLLPPEAVPDAAAIAREKELEHKLAIRRTMLQLHQVGGFITLAGLAATVVVGQLSFADKYGGGGDTGKYITAHETLAIGTSAVFAATGLLAVFAPSPIDKPLRLDTATVHKAAMAVATAGMVAELVLGVLTANHESSGNTPDYRLTQRNLAIAHQVIGYTTLVATAAGFTVLTF